MRINKLFIGVATVATGLALGSLQASAQTVMKFSSWLSPKHAVNAVVYPTWIAAIEKATNGRVTGKIEYNLAPPPGQIDLIQDGTADVAWSFHGYNPGRFITTKLIEVPGLPGDAEAASVAAWRAYEKFFAKNGEHKGVYLAGIMTHGPGQTHMREPISKLEDFKGKKIRIGGGMSADVAEALGVVGVQVPAPKVYETLSQGVADGVWMPMETNQSLRLFEVAPYTTLMPGGLYRGSFGLFMSESFLNKLSEEDRKAVLSTTGEELSRMAGRAWADADIGGLENAKKTAKAVTEFSPEEAAKFKAIADKVRAKVVAEVAATGVDAEAALKFIEETMANYGK
ncbi:MAG: TRAP transporter substrate-binding protein [Rhodobiaceae bacterium]|nr:TRAP transporter substrate-binding protein [Rhodobiaceae bacterium]